jgi:hypothetical protein
MWQATSNEGDGTRLLVYSYAIIDKPAPATAKFALNIGSVARMVPFEWRH